MFRPILHHLQGELFVTFSKLPDFCNVILVTNGPGWLSRYSDSPHAGQSGDRIPVGGEIFRTRPDRPWDPPSLRYNGYQLFPGGIAAGAWCWPPPPHLSADVGQYLYSPSGSSSSVIGRTFTSTFRHSKLNENKMFHVRVQWWHHCKL